MEYSGRTTALAHKGNDWRKHLDVPISSAISQMTVFNVQWTDCPVEVEAEIRRLWREADFGNDNYYFGWKRDSDAFWIDEDEFDDDGEIVEQKTLAAKYPVIDEYLVSKGVTECLIHWWW